MKKNYLFLATLLVVAAVSVAVVSCKKEKQDNPTNNKIQSGPTFNPRAIEDMNAYLKDFKQKMRSATKGDDEALSLEDAAWHLSSVANYEFANANVEFTDLRYDTLYYHLNVVQEKVNIADLYAVYLSMVDDIDGFYQNLDLQEKHMRFINASISENGEITVVIVTSFVVLDHVWHFPSDFYADSICTLYFSEDSIYTWNGLAITELKRIANILESRNFILPGESSTSRVYYVYTMDYEFNFQNYTDPYGSPFDNNSRIFCVSDDSNATPVLSVDDMCYCLDSYLGLPFEYVNDHPSYGNQRPVLWKVEAFDQHFLYNHFHTFYHRVTVTFGQFYVVPNDDPNQD